MVKLIAFLKHYGVVVAIGAISLAAGIPMIIGKGHFTGAADGGEASLNQMLSEGLGGSSSKSRTAQPSRASKAASTNANRQTDTSNRATSNPAHTTPNTSAAAAPDLNQPSILEQGPDFETISTAVDSAFCPDNATSQFRTGLVEGVIGNNYYVFQESCSIRLRPIGCSELTYARVRPGGEFYFGPENQRNEALSQRRVDPDNQKRASEVCNMAILAMLNSKKISVQGEAGATRTGYSEFYVNSIEILND